MKDLMTEYDTSKADLLLQVFALSFFCCPVNVSLLGAIWYRRSRLYHGWIPSPTLAIYTSCWSTMLDVHLRSLVWQNHRCFSSILIKWPHGKGPNRRSILIRILSQGRALVEWCLFCMYDPHAFLAPPGVSTQITTILIGLQHKLPGDWPPVEVQTVYYIILSCAPIRC